MKIIGLIPARKGSKRIPDKNMAFLNGKPLLRHAIESAMESKIFDRLVVTSNYRTRCLAWIPSDVVDYLYRPAKLCTDEAHDYQWVKHALDCNPGFDLFAILRPTSPFRTADTIRRAFAEFDPSYDSLRAVEPTKHHPYKSWIMKEDRIFPLICCHQEWLFHGSFDLPTQLLPKIYCQNACIHIAKTEVLEKFGNVSGEVIKPFFTKGVEGIDINTPKDLEYAEWIMRGMS